MSEIFKIVLETSAWSHFTDNLILKKTIKNMYGTKINISPFIAPLKLALGFFR